MTNAKICSIKFENKDIINVIKALDPCKAHGYDDISIRMLKICDSAIVKPLTILFKNCISEGIFPDNWKKSNICPIHKKGDKQIVDNYRPVSLLPVCGKIFERLIFNSLYQFLEEHNLFWGNPHSTYAQKSSKLDPLPLYAIARIWLDPPLCVSTFYISPLQINLYSDSSFRHSQFLGYFVSEVKFH